MPATRIKSVLSRQAIEVRFRPNLVYFEDVFRKASLLESNFDDWQIKHDPLDVVLFSDTNKKLLNISGDRIVAIDENSTDYSESSIDYKVNYQLFLTDSNIDTIRRVGVREIHILETSLSFKDLTTKLYESFTTNTDRLSEIAFDSINDYAFVIDGVKNGFNNHVRFGPVNPIEARQRFNSTFKDSVELSAEGNIYLDIDIYDESGSEAAQGEKNILQAINESREMTQKFINLFKESL